MARKKTPPEEPKEEETQPTATEVAEDDRPEASPNEVAETDEEVETADKLSPEEQAELLRQREASGQDVSLDRAKLNIKGHRRMSAIAVLTRIEPEEFPIGHRIKGTIRRWDGTFSDIEIETWTLRYRRGGLYRIYYYDADGTLVGRREFEIEGDPLTPDEIKRRESEERVEEDAKRVAAVSAPKSGDGNDRQRELEREIEALKTKSMLESVDRRHQEQMDRLTQLVEKLGSAPKAPTTVEVLGTALASAAPFVPVLKAWVEKSSEKSSGLKEMLGAVQSIQADQQKNMKTLVDELKPGKSPMEAATTKLIDLAIAKTLGPNSGSGDPAKVAMDMIQTMLPTIIERALDIGRIGQPKGDDEGEGGGGAITPRYAIEKFSEFLKTAFERAQHATAPVAAAPVASALPPGYVQTPWGPMTYAAAQALAQQAAAASVKPGTMGQYPFSGAPPVNVAGASPVAPTAPVAAATGPMAAATGAAPVSAGAGSTAPVATAPPIAQQPATWDIHPQVFVMAKTYMDAGKTGDELADDVEKQHKALISERAVAIMEEKKPEELVSHVIEAIPPQIMAAFIDPTTNQPSGKFVQFVKEFCAFFYETEDDEPAKS